MLNPRQHRSRKLSDPTYSGLISHVLNPRLHEFEKLPNSSLLDLAKCQTQLV